MRVAYFDCLSGISGDMVLGALIDAGADRAVIESGIRSLGLGELSLETSIVKKCGFRSTYVQVQHPPEHAHRHLSDIHRMIDGAVEIDDNAKALAKRIFRNLGEAEAHVHGTSIEKVHFHEVGAVDSIADIVGCAIGMRTLGIDRVESSAVPTGTGFVQIAHGRVSIPAPATAELLKGIPLSASDIECELTTPTGAAILKTMAERYGAIPSMRIEAIGYGAGTKDLPSQANVLRLVLGEASQGPSGFASESDEVVIVESNIDNTTAEDLASCVEVLWDQGALDVYQTGCQMKKGRMGTLVTVVCAPSRLSSIEEVLLKQTGTIGVRHQRARRRKLIRVPLSVETEFGKVHGKCVWAPGGYWRFSVEHDDAVELARQQGLTVEQVRELAAAAFQNHELPAPPESPMTAG